MKQQKARKNWPLLLLRAITIPIDKRTDTKNKAKKKENMRNLNMI